MVPFVAGCGPGEARVSGRVLYQDKPLPGGRVTFRPADSRRNSVSTPISPEGTYEATLPVGEVRISVDNRELEPPPSAAPPPSLPNFKPPAGVVVPPPKKEEHQKPPGTYIPIPEQYYTIEKSGLTYTVTKGSQTHDIVLK
jgi:hypothetical protein